MAKIHQVQNHLYFFCPGCKTPHAFSTAWEFNGDINNPTASPSILVTWRLPSGEKRCHSFIRNGKIEFCSDSYHDLKGQTVDLPEVPLTLFSKDE